MDFFSSFLSFESCLIIGAVKCNLTLSESGQRNFSVSEVLRETSSDDSNRRIYVCEPSPQSGNVDLISCVQEPGGDGESCGKDLNSQVSHFTIGSILCVEIIWKNAKYLLIGDIDYLQLKAGTCDDRCAVASTATVFPTSESTFVSTTDQPPVPTTTTKPADSNDSALAASLGTTLPLIAVLAAVLGVLYWRRKRKQEKPSETQQLPGDIPVDNLLNDRENNEIDNRSANYVDMGACDVTADACANEEGGIYEAVRPTSEFVYTSLEDTQEPQAEYGNMAEIERVKDESEETEMTDPYDNFDA